MLRGGAFVAAACVLCACGSSSGSNVGFSGGAPGTGGNAGASGAGAGGAGGKEAPGIGCGASTCDVETAVCCRTGSDQPFSYACVSKNIACAPLDLQFVCDDETDCIPQGGGICCLYYESSALTTRCMPAKSCIEASGASGVILCEPKQVAAPCPAGMSCIPSDSSVPGYDLCK